MPNNRNRVCLLVTLAAGVYLITCGWGRSSALAEEPQSAQTPQAFVPSTNIPDDVQLSNGDSHPTLRIPVSHSSWTWILLKQKIRASYGWLEIDRESLRYSIGRPSRYANEADQGLSVSRSEIADIKIEYEVAAFRAGKQRHYFGYSPQNHWDAADSSDSSLSSVTKADKLRTSLILRALQNFDGLVADVKLRQQPAAAPPVVAQPTVAPPIQPPAATPVPPTLVVMTPSGVNADAIIEMNESPLTVRGVATDGSGLPTVTINAETAALRPRGENVAEFWSDPIALKVGDNPLDIAATTPQKATAHFRFVVHYAPRTAPVNPQALDKAELISLLVGAVPPSRVAGIVKERGIKFVPTADDLNAIRAVGGTDEVVQAIQQAATTGK